MKWPDAPLIPGVFEERLHRFGARVRVNGKVEYCHVPNSGRLRELLRSGAKVGLADPALNPGAGGTVRKTRYTLRLAYWRGKWVCIEANQAPRLLYEAWKEGRVPALRKYDRLQAEVPLDAHTRFDFKASDTRTGRTAWIEVKCVTLVESDGTARFPDAPSERASKHLRELARLAARTRTDCFVFFIVQNPRALRVGPKESTDPVFARNLREAAGSKVRLGAFRAKVDQRGARLEKPLRVILTGDSLISAKA